ERPGIAVELVPRNGKGFFGKRHRVHSGLWNAPGSSGKAPKLASAPPQRSDAGEGFSTVAGAAATDEQGAAAARSGAVCRFRRRAEGRAEAFGQAGERKPGKELVGLGRTHGRAMLQPPAQDRIHGRDDVQNG